VIAPAKLLQDAREWYHLKDLAMAARDRLARGEAPTAPQLEALERLAPYPALIRGWE
jgi:hypothetical protein